MADYDPNRTDPNRIDPSNPGMRDSRLDAARGFNWNWVIGGIAAVVVLLVALSFVGRSGNQSADIANPPATTGQASPRQSSSPNPAPTTPNATTPSMAPSTPAPSPTPPAKQ